MELCAGAPEALLVLARRWVQRHGLWLDVRSKAERGVLLAAGRWTSPPVPWPESGASNDDLQGAGLRACLGMVLANASVLGDPALESLLSAEQRALYLHPCRLGLQAMGQTCAPEAQGDGAVSTALGQLDHALGQGADAASLVRGQVFNATMLTLLRRVYLQTPILGAVKAP